VLLRGSSEHTGETYDYAAILGAADGGIAHGDVLIAFAEAFLGTDDARLARARDGLAAAMGWPAMVDSAAVVAIFESAVRIADATGIPLEDAKQAASADLRADLGIDAFPGAAP
jgi:hypothetical protein